MTMNRQHDRVSGRTLHLPARLVVLGALLPLLGCDARTGGETDRTSRGVSSGSPADLKMKALGQRPARSAPESGTVSRYLVLDGPGSIASVRGQDLRDPAVRRIAAARARALRARHAVLRPALEATGAVIVGDLVHLANAFQVRVPRERLSALARLPGVVRLETPTVVAPTLGMAVPLLGAPEVWETAPGLHGEGVRIGILDTGIDYLHAHLGGSGDPADATANDRTFIEAGSFPTARVIGGRDFAGDGYDALGLEGDATPVPDADPADCYGHGTHVAGIAAGVGVTTDGSAYAGPWDASLDPTDFALYPGVAPGAKLFALKVFGCAGSTDLILPALELAVDPDEDGDVGDRLDVVNASLGSSFAGGATEAELAAHQALSDAGTLLVAAAGNDGGASRVPFAVGYPGSLPQTLTVGATFREASANTYLALQVSAPGSVAGTYPVGQTNETPNITSAGSISGTAVGAEPALACDPLSNAADLAGKIAIVRRGTCIFNTKAANAQAAGAIAVIVVNNTYSDFPLHPFNGGGAHVLPMFMLRGADGEALLAAAPLTVSLTAGDTTEVSYGPDYMAYTSSRGPTADALQLKPDVTAPGVRILSALVGTGVGGAAWDGTSMATPLVAGAAALLRQGRPGLGPLEVKALLTSTARPVINGFGDGFLSSLAGAGRVQVDAALQATVTARVEGLPGEAGASFGAVLAAEPRTETRTLVIANSGPGSAALDVVLEPALGWPGVTVEVSPGSLDVPAGGTASVTLSLTVDPAALPAAPTYEAFTNPTGSVSLNGAAAIDVPTIFLTEATGAVSVRPSGAANAVARVAYHGIVRAAAARTVSGVAGCLNGADERQPGLVLGGTPASHDNATSVLVLGTRTSSFDDPTGPDASRDIVAVGALVDPDSERVFFGVATAADWATPSRGWSSEVGIEIDTDGDGEADYLVLAESFTHTDPAKAGIVVNGSPFARVVDLATGELSASFQPLNGALAAYPGGVFFAGDPPETYETQVYLNNVVVFPVKLSDLGLDSSTNGALSYRGVSAVSRVHLVLGVPRGAPLDTTDWVAFDAAAPQLLLRSCHRGTPLCPNDDGPIPLVVSGDASALPELLVLHHANATGPRFETVDLVAGLESSNLSVTADATGTFEVGSDGATTFTVRNTGATRRAGVRLDVAVTGGTLAALAPSSGTCDATGCELGDLAADATATVVATVQAAAPGTLGVTATVRAETPCDTSATDDEASVTFTVTEAEEPPDPEPKSGCGCRSAGGADGVAGLLLLLLLWPVLRRRRAREPSVR